MVDVHWRVVAVFVVAATSLLHGSCDKSSDSAESSASSTTEHSSEKTSSDTTGSARQKGSKESTARGSARKPQGGDDKERDRTADTGAAASGSSKSDTGSEGMRPGDLAAGTERERRLLQKAKKAFMRNKLEEAEPRFEKVIDAPGPLSGAKASAYIALGQIYVQTDRPERAVDLLEHMPEPGDKVVEARLVLARAYSKMDRIDGAIEEYEAIIDLQPNYIFVYPTLGSLYTEQGEDKKAAKIYLKYENRLESMARAVEDPDSSEPLDRVNALDYLSAVEDERAIEAVKSALDDPNPSVRAKAAKTVGTMRIDSAKSKLRSMSKTDDSRRVRAAAARAHRALGREESSR